MKPEPTFSPAPEKSPRGPCPREGHPKGLRMEARQPHPCPYKSEIHDDRETLCRCCSVCTAECAADI